MDGPGVERRSVEFSDDRHDSFIGVASRVGNKSTEQEENTPCLFLLKQARHHKSEEYRPNSMLVVLEKT